MNIAPNLFGNTAQKEMPAAPQAAAASKGMDKMFMTLLVAQIKNQNPLEPSDPAEFMSQLVQMNLLQEAQENNRQLSDQTMLLREIQGTSFGSLIGQQALVNGTSLSLDGKETLSGQLTLSSEDPDVRLTLQGSNGQHIQIPLGPLPAGTSQFAIDDKMLARYRVTAGTWKASLTSSTDTDKKTNTAALEFRGTVSSVQLSVNGNPPVLTLKGIGEFPATEITAIQARA